MDEYVTVLCDSCLTAFRAPKALRGRKACCPRCTRLFVLCPAADGITATQTLDANMIIDQPEESGGQNSSGTAQPVAAVGQPLPSGKVVGWHKDDQAKVWTTLGANSGYSKLTWGRVALVIVVLFTVVFLWQAGRSSNQQVVEGMAKKIATLQSTYSLLERNNEAVTKELDDLQSEIETERLAKNRILQELQTERKAKQDAVPHSGVSVMNALTKLHARLQVGMEKDECRRIIGEVLGEAKLFAESSDGRKYHKFSELLLAACAEFQAGGTAWEEEMEASAQSKRALDTLEERRHLVEQQQRADNIPDALVQESLKRQYESQNIYLEWQGKCAAALASKEWHLRAALDLIATARKSAEILYPGIQDR